MNRDDSASAIGMLKEMMTTFCSNDLKTYLLQRTNKLFACNGGESAHTLTDTR